MFTNRGQFNSLKFNDLGLITVKGGSEATVIASTQTSGYKSSVGSSESVVCVSLEGQGIKSISISASTAIMYIDVDASGQKQARSPPSQENIEINPFSSGQKFVLGQNESSILTTEEGEGQKQASTSQYSSISVIHFSETYATRIGKSTSLLETLATGIGTKTFSADSEAEVEIQVLSDSIVCRIGEQATTIIVSSEGVGWVAHSFAEVLVASQGAGYKLCQNSSEALLFIDADGQHRKYSVGQNDSFISIEAEEQGYKIGIDGNGQDIVIDPAGEYAKIAIGQSQSHINLLVETIWGKFAFSSNICGIVTIPFSAWRKETSSSSQSVIDIFIETTGYKIGTDGSWQNVLINGVGENTKIAIGQSQSHINLLVETIWSKLAFNSSICGIVTVPFSVWKKEISSFSQSTIDISIETTGIPVYQGGNSTGLVILEEGSCLPVKTGKNLDLIVVATDGKSSRYSFGASQQQIIIAAEGTFASFMTGASQSQIIISFNSVESSTKIGASDSIVVVAPVYPYTEKVGVFRDSYSGQIVSYNAVSNCPNYGFIRVQDGFIHPTNLLSVTQRHDDIPFAGIKAIAIEDATKNLFGIIGASNDWSKWSHFENPSLWTSSRQIIGHGLGKVFEGNPATTSPAFIIEALPQLEQGGYTFSIYLKTNKQTSLTAKAILEDSGIQVAESQLQSLQLSTAWTRVQFQLSLNEPVDSGVLSLLFDLPSTDVVISSVRPQLEKAAFASSYCQYERSQSKLVYSLPNALLNNGTISFRAKYIDANEEVLFITITDKIQPNNRITLTKVPVDGSSLKIQQDTAGTTIYDLISMASDSLYHFYAITWSINNGIRLFVDGTLLTSIGYTPVNLDTLIFSLPGNKLIANLRADKREVPAGEIAEWAQMDRPFAVPNKTPVS